MIDITLHKTGNEFDGFVVKGHAGYGDFGEDIICASVSILSYTALNSMELVAGISVEDMIYHIDEETGFLSITTKKINEKTDVIYRCFSVGIESLLENYSEYITLKTEEV